MFHANGWGHPFAATGMGAKHVVLRQVDGTEILRRIEQHGVTYLCAAPAVVAAVLDARQDLGRRDPRPRPRAHHRRRRAAADPDDRARTRGAGLGVHPDLRAHRDRATADDEPDARRVGRPRPAPSRPATWAEPARRSIGVRMMIDDEGEVLAQSQPQPQGLLGQPRGHRRGAGRRLVPHRRRRDVRGRLHRHRRPQEGRHHHRRRERLVDRGRGRAACRTQRCARSRSSASPTRSGASWSRRSSCSTPTREPVDRGGTHRALPRAPRRLQVPQEDRVPRRARAYGDRQAAEVQAARAVLGGPRPPGQLTSVTSRRPSTVRPGILPPLSGLSAGQPTPRCSRRRTRR